ncbi:MAG: hypothetical protein NWQ13_02875 [Glaciimonas sp.]|nr:hypothetical protein [Glaciimonas sp.]
MLAAAGINHAANSAATIDASAVHISLWVATGVALLATLISGLRIKKKAV